MKKEEKKEEKKGEDEKEKIYITRGAPFRGRFKLGAGGAPSPGRPHFSRDRAPHFVWALKTKRMHEILRFDFEN